jgi:hypothetical protein
MIAGSRTLLSEQVRCVNLSQGVNWMRWAGNVACIVQNRNSYNLVGRSERKETA